MNKNDKLLILEGAVNDENVEALVKAFKEELKPVGIAIKDWAKAT